FFLSLLGSAAFRILIRFTSSVLTLRRIAALQKKIHPDATNESINTIMKTAEQMEEEFDVDIPIFDCDDTIGPTITFPSCKNAAHTSGSLYNSQQKSEIPNIVGNPVSTNNEHAFYRDSIFTQSTVTRFASYRRSRQTSETPSTFKNQQPSITITIESSTTSKQHYSMHQTIAKAIERRISTTDNPATQQHDRNQDSLQTLSRHQQQPQHDPPVNNVKSFLLDIIEQAITILNLDNRTLESIGLDSIASMTSDLFSKAAATIAIFVLLSTSSPPFPSSSSQANTWSS
ncbi:hypothetical protein HDU76_010427, partial [Blyttiomyces sp. JEL0837]